MNKKNIIIVLVLVTIGFIAFEYLSGPNSSTTSSLSADVSTSNSTDAQQIYSLLQEMQAVKLYNTIFSSNTFQSLKDNTVVFAPQPAGRNNPFSPIGSDINGAAVSTTTKK